MATKGPQWSGTPHIKGATESIQLALLAFCLIGVQICWGVEMTYCTPYLLQLGLTKSRLSLVWIAGPLSGLIMQPVVGVLADRSTSRWGRRRPIMVGGSICVVLSMLVLGWTKEIVRAFVTDKDLEREMTIVVAVVSIYVIDFAINAVMASCRSLMVDTLPISKQQLGSAWSSRLIAAGHTIGYGAGALDLTAIFGGILGDTQFKQLICVAIVALLGGVGVTCYATTERVLISSGIDDDQQSGVWETITQLLSNSVNLPSRIKAICMVQFWSWIGWFPFLFYISTWVGEIYLRYDVSSDPLVSTDLVGDIGRVGSRALIVFSLLNAVWSVTLPWLIRSPQEESTPLLKSSSVSPPRQLSRFKPSLLTAWTLSCLQFAAAMVFAPFVTSVRAATFLIAMCSIPFALSCWAPYTFMGIEINKRSSGAPIDSLGSPTSRRDSISSLEMAGSTGELAGRYLGILNVYMTVPQFIGSGISMLVFGALEPGKSPEFAKDAPQQRHQTDGVNGIAVCLLIGALSNVVAARAARRLRT